MLTNAHVFSGFSVDDLTKAREFYGATLGLNVRDEGIGIAVEFDHGKHAFLCPKPDHQPATFTVLNFSVPDIDQTVAELKNKGVVFESVEGIPTDEKGIVRGKTNNMGPDIAWFKDPAGNFLAVLEE